MTRDSAKLTLGKTFTFFAHSKLAVAIFLVSAAWSLMGTKGEYASLAASLFLTLSGAYLVAGGYLWLYRRVNEWKHSPKRLLKTALGQATPLEKSVLKAVIQRGSHKVDLDVGSPIAIHLLQIGLITKAPNLLYTMYQLAGGLADLCTRQPTLLRVTDEEQKATLAEWERWRTEGVHKRFLTRYSVAAAGSGSDTATPSNGFTSPDRISL
jgi:hypothetical protein